MRGERAVNQPCGPCGPLPATSCSGVVTIVQGYAKTYFTNLFYSDSGAPYDLTGALQIVVSHPASGAQPAPPVNEFLSVQTVLVTTANLAIGSNQLTGMTTTAGLAEGQSITGAGIPVNTTVVSVTPPISSPATPGSVTMSANATANGVGISVTFATATNVEVVGAPGGGRIQVTLPPYDSADLLINPYPPNFQDLQVSVTNADGSITPFLLPATLNIVAPPYGVA